MHMETYSETTHIDCSILCGSGPSVELCHNWGRDSHLPKTGRDSSLASRSTRGKSQELASFIYFLVHTWSTFRSSCGVREGKEQLWQKGARWKVLAAAHFCSPATGQGPYGANSYVLSPVLLKSHRGPRRWDQIGLCGSLTRGLMGMERKGRYSQFTDVGVPLVYGSSFPVSPPSQWTQCLVPLLIIAPFHPLFLALWPLKGS